MTHDEVVAALLAAYPGVEWSYDGDGSTLEPIEGVQHGLQWHGPLPPPTLAELAAVAATLPASALPLGDDPASL